MYVYTPGQWALLFFFYCFCGWVWESCYVSAKQRHWVNRGFLHGPLLPIYGSGAIIILFATLPVADSFWLVYFLGMLAATALEYVVGAVMEQLFKVRYWDYTKQPFNLHGYICLTSSIAWGFFSDLLIYVIHPPIDKLLHKLPALLVNPLAAVIAVLFSLLAIALYIVIRFKRWQWGVGSVVSLAHDAILTIGLFSVFHGLLPFNMDVDQSFIAAILTIIGYSINDKVVIFDRIREYQTLYPKRRMRDNINNAINSTLARTLNTSGTTIVVLLAIFLFGGEVIRGFVFALMFGIVVGTLSSIFVATPIAYDLMKRSKEQDEKKA